MIRAILFDFYGVWLPDVFSEYLKDAEQRGPQVSDELVSLTNQYFHGKVSLETLAGKFKFDLNRPDIDADNLLLDVHSVSPALVDFMRELHLHFVKLGVLANLGIQEHKLLTDFNEANQVLEVIGGPLAFRSDLPLLSQEIFAQTLQAIGEAPASCLVVSGNEIYRNFATSLGMTALPFEGFPKLRQELNQRLATDISDTNN